jgi:NAD(P)H-dependent FMN reductase
MLNLKIIVTSTRPGRKGIIFGNWLLEEAKKLPEFNVELVDLAEINLPLMNEANHPAMRKYEHQHTKDWSAKIEEADAFIFVTPEYNYSFTAAFKNAIDYLHVEWKHKAAGIFSYGGISAGTRAQQMMRLVLASMSMTVVNEAVTIPMYTQHIDEDNNFSATEQIERTTSIMLQSVAKWGRLLKAIREDEAKK